LKAAGKNINRFLKAAASESSPLHSFQQLAEPVYIAASSFQKLYFVDTICSA
jgi:hypothetical protein